MFNFDLQRFGGKGGYQSSGPIIAELSPEQKQTIALQNQYLERTGPVLSDLVNKGSAALNAYQAPNFNQYAQQGMNITQDAMGMNKSLADGILPSAYKANVTQAVDDAVSPYRQRFTNMGSNGTLNSSLMRTLAEDMSRGATAAANSAINQNLTTASQLTGAYGSSASAPLAYQSNLYNAQTQPAKDFLTLGTQTYQPTGQAASQAYQWQAAMSAPAQNQYVQQPGLGGVFGSVLGGLAGNPGLFCFIAGTKISTPKGDVNIEDIAVGDMVSTLVGDVAVTKTIATDDMPVVKVHTDKGNFTCTESEVLLTVDGSQCVSELMQGDVLIRKDGGAIVTRIGKAGVAKVYEIVAPWFYANGFVVDGFDMEVN